jgi:general secretion pathway protein J
MQPHNNCARTLRGFTLVELLVALVVMALMSVMAWRGLDAMTRATAHTQQRADALMVLQTGMAQWGVDLDAMVDPPKSDPAKPDPTAPAALDWNGQVLRLTRTDPAGAPAGLRVVAWGRREVQGVSHWLRWQSQPIRDPLSWRAAWTQAALWGQNPGDAERRQELAVLPLADWQIFYFRNDAWSNPLSSAESAAATPDAVRLVLSLPSGGVLAGKLTRDWIRPTVAGAKP